MLILGAVFGQDTLSTHPIKLSRVKSAYETLKYPQVVELVKSELEARPQQPLERLEILLKYMALAQASLGSEAEAKATMASLVLVNPNFQFQPGEVSPKIQHMFDGVRREYVRTPQGDSKQVAYLIKSDRRSEFILKSITFPGWGQIESGKSRGYAWAVVFSASLIGSGVSAYMADQAHQSYLDAYDATDIQDRYSTYNHWYQWRNSLLSLTLLTYTGNLLDISLSTH